MLACPHCERECIARSELFLASRLIPKHCPNCGGLVGIEGPFYGSYVAVLEFLLIGSAAFLAHAQPLSTAFVLLLGWCGLTLVFSPLAPVTAISSAQVSVARRSVKILGAVFAVIALLALIYA